MKNSRAQSSLKRAAHVPAPRAWPRHQYCMRTCSQLPPSHSPPMQHACRICACARPLHDAGSCLPPPPPAAFACAAAGGSGPYFRSPHQWTLFHVQLLLIVPRFSFPPKYDPSAPYPTRESSCAGPWRGLLLKGAGPLVLCNQHTQRGCNRAPPLHLIHGAPSSVVTPAASNPAALASITAAATHRRRKSPAYLCNNARQPKRPPLTHSHMEKPDLSLKTVPSREYGYQLPQVL